ncbi:hypothetical protein I308_100996 [Cryptococcus tetragattii IND107]|uniref:Amine oxidase domain-containing protein n=1 Tax=Cryptococcus tetragattii IND107 TaxID=1296105 RepID=A0ABR3BZR5_9TREE|nr:hypothetical protein I308_05947 [Cryptococcus tetragattii IND107]
MKVAVIGSGLAGLTTAYLLRQHGFEVWLIERSSSLGFYSESIEMDQASTKTARGKSRERKWIIDVPMRGFQGGYYPKLLSLYTHLGLPVVPVKYTFSFSSSQSTYFIHSGASGASMPSLPSEAFTDPSRLARALMKLFGIALCYLLLIALSFAAWHDFLPPSLSSTTLTVREFTINLSSFLSRPIRIPVIGLYPWTPLGNVFEDFMGTIVLPLFSAVGTMTAADVWAMPVRLLLEYVHTTLGTSHYHLGDGFSSADVARLLAAPVKDQGPDYVRLKEEVVGLEYALGGGVRIKLRPAEDLKTTAEETLRVEKVVLATQASVSGQLLRNLDKSLKHWGEEKERRRIGKMVQGLQTVKYRETIVVNHTDASILPPLADRRDINLYLPLEPCSLPEIHSSPSSPYFKPTSDSIYAMATQIIYPKSCDGQPVLQTTNPVISIGSKRVLRVSKLERALAISNPHETLPLLQPHSLNALIYLAGSYVYPGIPLLEGCVGSAKDVVKSILEGERYHIETKLGESPDMWDKKKRGRKIEPVGGIDWEVGRGGLIMRAWRWRWNTERTWS